MLAKAVATECRTTFFNISASTLVSKYRGDSEKLVRALFDLARYHSPSTIFLDEIDSILGARHGDGSEHEASRRMKTELLVQMDGISSKAGASSSSSSFSDKRSRQEAAAPQVFVMAASNMPWDLDVAVLRRLEKRVLVPLPPLEARLAMLTSHLADRMAVDAMDLPHIAQATDGYSGADIELLCREAAMKPVRRLMTRLQGVDLTPSSSVTGSKARVGVSDAQVLLSQDPVSMEDVTTALASTKPSSDGNVDKYLKWQSEFGSV